MLPRYAYKQEIAYTQPFSFSIVDCIPFLP